MTDNQIRICTQESDHDWADHYLHKCRSTGEMEPCIVCEECGRGECEECGPFIMKKELEL